MADNPQDANISGNWINELGSHVTFHQDDRTLTGTYKTKVSSYPLSKETFPLNGNIGTGSPTSLGFAVSYQAKDKPEEKSTGSWSGQYRKLADGKEVIYATWTLTEPAENDGDIWMCTTVGQDTFTREN